MFKLVKVTGASMHPCYRDGDFVLLARWWWRPLRKGDDVVCRHPELGLVLKRIHAVGDAVLELTGLAHASIDRAQMGPVSRRDVVGRVVMRLARRPRSSGAAPRNIDGARLGHRGIAR